MARTEQALGLKAVREVQGRFAKMSESGKRALAIIEADQNRTAGAELMAGKLSNRPVLDLASVNNPFGTCRIILERSVLSAIDGSPEQLTVIELILPSWKVKEALSNIGKSGAKPVVASGTYRRQIGDKLEAAEENVILEAAMPAEGTVTFNFSGEPTNSKLMENMGRPADFGHIHLKTPLTFGETQLPAGYTKTVLPPVPEMEG
jgi:hypothetical protein